MSNSFSSKDAADALLLAISLRASGFAAHVIVVGNVTIQGLVDLQAPKRHGVPGVPDLRAASADDLLQEMGGEAYDELQEISAGKPTTPPTSAGGVAVIVEDD